MFSSRPPHPAHMRKVAGCYEIFIQSDTSGLFADIQGVGAVEAPNLASLLRKIGEKIAKEEKGL